MAITIFKNLAQTNTPFFKEIDVILNRIKTGVSKETVLKVRANKETANDIKKQLPSYLF
jgi:hypothetical protein